MTKASIYKDQKETELEECFEHCEECECEIETGLDLNLCTACYDCLYCECGSELETKGEPGMCRKCD